MSYYLNCTPGPPFLLPDSSNMQQRNCVSEYTEELWQACAGPLVSLPKVNQRVWYFPQGHMEQVVASTQPGTECQLPQCRDLPSQVLCRVVHLSLSAEPDTDDVYAQLSLLPESDQTCNVSAQEEEVTPQSNPLVRIFTKILTASDTSTHGGFSVLRKHAEDCLPLLDMSRDTPSQELVATDLHGQEWKFRHTYRGHPRRHLLTTGWSFFLSQKRLVAGDAVIFLRGEDGKMRVGIRRAKRQQITQPFSVLTSHSMRMGVVATALYSLTARTMFGVYYKPRLSPSSFVVPVEKLANCLSKNFSIGTRFKVKLESEDASERSFAGTITGIGDIDASCWPNSKWRSLMVNWDEISMYERLERVSPWEIELCVLSSTSPSPAPKSKRFCSSSISDAPISTQGRVKETVAPATESWMLRHDERRHGFFSEVLAAVPPEEGRKMMDFSSHYAHQRFDGLGQVHDHHAQQQQVHNVQQQHALSFHRPFISPDIASNPPFTIGSVPMSSFGINGSEVVQAHARAWQSPSSSSTVDTPHRMLPLASSSHCAIGNQALSSFSPWEQHSKEKLPAATGCKLFGFPLIESPPVMSDALKMANLSGVSEEDHAKVEASSQEHATCREPLEAVLHMPLPVCLPAKSSISADHEKSNNGVPKFLREMESRDQSNPPRSCTKVSMKGSMVGRGVDLSKYDSYEMLIKELEGMFHIEGELSNPDKGWQVAYNDNEGDMMHVGDDPWMEFCSMVRKIHIFSPEEVQSAGVLLSPKEMVEMENHHGKDQAGSIRLDTSTYEEVLDSSAPALQHQGPPEWVDQGNG